MKSLTGSQREYIRGQMNRDENMFMLLDIARLLAAPEVMVDRR
jgi:chemotaxis signal transduction protein